MKKLLTILSTIIITSISSVATYATCNDLYSHGTLTMGYFDVHYYTQSGTGQIVQTVSPPSTYYVYPADTIYLNQLNVYFASALSPAKLYQFSGSFNFTSTQANDFNLNYPTTLPAPSIIDSSGHEIGYCDIPTVPVNTSSTSRYYSGNDFYAYKNIPYTVQCHSNGTGSPIGISFKLDFGSLYGAINQYPFSVSPYVSQPFTYSNNEYDYNFCTLQEAIQNISFSDSGITGAINTGTQNIINNNNSNTQDIINNQDSNTQDIIDNNNNNTQQIVDQLTSESCSQVSCSNLFHPQGTASGGSVTTVGDSYVEFTRRSNSIDNQIYFSDGYATLERGKTYYYKLDCSSDLIYNIAFGGDGNMTQYLSCGSGSFVWNSLTVTRLNQLRYSNNRPDQSTTFRIDIFLSETDGDFCNYGTTIEECSGSNRLDTINDSINNISDDLTDTDTSDVDDELEDLFDSDIEDFGLSDFTDTISSYVLGVANTTCSPIHLDFPYLQNKYIDLPCLTPIYQQKFGLIYDLYALIIRGIISYICVIEIYKTIHDILNPDDNKIVMLDL